MFDIVKYIKVIIKITTLYHIKYIKVYPLTCFWYYILFNVVKLFGYKCVRVGYSNIARKRQQSFSVLKNPWGSVDVIS